MRRIMIVLLFCAAASAEDREPDVTACRTCHKGPLGLVGNAVTETADALRGIVDGARPHPPVSLSDTSDKALEAIARELVAEDTKAGDR